MGKAETLRILPPEIRQDTSQPPRLHLRNQVYRASAHQDTDAFASLFAEALQGLSCRHRGEDSLSAQECVQAAYQWKDVIPSQSALIIRNHLLSAVQNFPDKLGPNYLARAIAALIRMNEPQLHKSPRDIHKNNSELDGKIIALDRNILSGSDLEELIAVTRGRGVEIALEYYANLEKYIYFQGDDHTPFANMTQRDFASAIGLTYDYPRLISMHTHPGGWDRPSLRPSPEDRLYFRQNPNCRTFICGHHVTWTYYGDTGSPLNHGWQFQEYASDGRPVGKWRDSQSIAKTFNEIVQKNKGN